jgi:LemA protein
MAHEQTVYKDIADARAHYATAETGSEAKVQATSQMEGALARLLVVMENYPNLKADASVKGLMDEIAGTENRINVARQRYNETVMSYNIDIKKFPRNVLAGMFNFSEKPLFTVQTQDANSAPKVDLEIK